MDKSSLRSRLESHARLCNVLAREIADNETFEHLNELDEIKDLSDDGQFARSLNNAIESLRPIPWPRDRPPSLLRIRESLIQYCLLRKEVFYEEWHCAENLDEQAADNDNLVSCEKVHRSWKLQKACLARDNDLEDLLQMFGRLARNIKSAFLPRVITLLADMNDVIHWSAHPSRTEATRLVDEFCTCWRLVLTEVRLLDEEEKLEAYPHRPIREMSSSLSDVVDFLGWPAGMASDESHERAWKDYRRRLKNLMPPEDESFAVHPMRPLSTTIAKLAEDAEKREFTSSAPLSNEDYKLLAHILSVDTTLEYSVFEVKDGEDEYDPNTWETFTCDTPTEEDEYKIEIIKNLKRYLDVLCDQAKEIESKACEDLVRCQELIGNYYNTFFDCDQREIEFAAQLKTFITCLRRGLATFWVDHKNYNPAKTRKDVAEIKAHVTAEADREIAAKAPKRKRQFGHEGNGLKGPKSTFMMRQRKIFEKYLAAHPVDGKNTRIVRAHQCWLKHKDAWDRAAKAQGDAKGYANHKILAQAK